MSRGKEGRSAPGAVGPARAGRVGLGVLLAVLALLAASCSASTHHASRPTPSPSLSAPWSPYQEAILRQGAVTLAEYQRAFAAFQKCANASGGTVTVVSRDPVSGLITFGAIGAIKAGTSDEPNLSTPEGRCYHQYFDEVQFAFETTNPVVIQQGINQNLQLYRQVMTPCLRKNGDKAPPHPTVGSAAFGQLSKEWSALNNEGKCSTSPPVLRSKAAHQSAAKPAKPSR